MMNRQEAIQKLREENYTIAPDQEFEVYRMEPRDAWGVARCFFAVYGEHYPFDVYYIPERLIEENRLGNVHSVVARTRSGDVIAYGALFRSSAYSSKVLEWGQGLVLPEYRSSMAIFCIQDCVLREVAVCEDIDAIFGEPVCNHVMTQRLCAIEGFDEVGLEVGLMPPEAYPSEEFPADRISAMLCFKVLRDTLQEVYIPEQYSGELQFILAGLECTRNMEKSGAKVPAESSTGFDSRFFDMARVARVNLYRAGEDFPRVLERFEEEAQNSGMQVRQFFVNLGRPCSGWAVAQLRERGYFFGGFLPLWFDTDGLLMQKVSELPNPGSIKLYSKRARGILGLLREDIRSNPACVQSEAWARW